MRRRSFLAAALAVAFPLPAVPAAREAVLGVSAGGVSITGSLSVTGSVFSGELGRVEGFRFIESEFVPPPALTVAAVRRITRALRPMRVEPVGGEYVFFTHPSDRGWVEAVKDGDRKKGPEGP
jgi:hypothetical protein